MVPVKPAVIVVMALGKIPMIPVAPMTVMSPMGVLPVSWRTPMATSPGPMVVAPSPTPSHPDVTGYGATRGGLYNRSRHWRLYYDRRGSHNNRGWKRDPKVYVEMNPGICSGNSQSRQSQNCDSLFHNLYRFDASHGENIVTTSLPICNEAGMGLEKFYPCLELLR